LREGSVGGRIKGQGGFVSGTEREVGRKKVAGKRENRDGKQL